MHRRDLILTGTALGLTAAGVRARAQTALPPARSADDNPPVQRFEDGASAAPGAPHADGYPAYRPDPNAGYRPSVAPAPPRYGDVPAPGTRAYDEHPDPEGPPAPDRAPEYAAQTRAETYSRDEIVNNVSDFFGVTAEAAGSAVERVFSRNGRPTGYIAGEEASGAFFGGLRYGKGLLYMKRRSTLPIFWQGPTVGWDFGGNASRVFTLCYNLQYPEAIFRRFPGVEGTAYLIAGLGVNYQRAEDITLAPMRTGLGLRLGANVGYLAYSRSRHWFPL